jgi:serine protease DegQ
MCPARGAAAGSVTPRIPRFLLAGLVMPAGCRTGATTAPGRNTPAPQASLQAAGAWPLPDIVRRIEPSVVAVLTEAGEGSGVVWSEDGLVVTNNHVVQGARNFTLAFADGKRSPATVVDRSGHGPRDPAVGP